MFLALPIRDEPRAPGQPWATYALMALNIGLFVLIALPLMVNGIDPAAPDAREYLLVMTRLTGASYGQLLRESSAYDVFVFAHGFRASQPNWHTLFTYMFLHGSALHLAGNMLFLWVAGRNVEHRLGAGRYLLSYVALGLVAGLIYWLMSGRSQAPMVGASGAIFGVMGCYFIWFPKHRVVLLVVLFWLVRLVQMPARWVLGLYVLVADLLPMFFDQGSNVAHSAHIGGFAGGIGLACGVLWFLERRQRPPPQPGAPVGSIHDGPAQIIAAALAAGGWSAALREYTLMSPGARQLLPPQQVFDLADGLSANGDHEAALAVLRRFISAHPVAPALAGAHLRAGTIHLRGLGRATAAAQHMLTVLDLEPTPAEAQAARRLLAEIEAKGGTK